MSGELRIKLHASSSTRAGREGSDTRCQLLGQLLQLLFVTTCHRLRNVASQGMPTYLSCAATFHRDHLYIAGSPTALADWNVVVPLCQSAVSMD